MMIEEFILAIKREASQKKNFLLAIDGRCASGKSTLAHALSQALDANLIHMDDFFLRPEQRTPQRLATPGENIDHERFLAEVLLPLREGKSFSYVPFSCRTMMLDEPVQVTPSDITIIEGSYACHPSLRTYYDLCVFMTVDPEEQMRRLKERDGDYAEVFRKRWIPLEEAYFNACNVEESCRITLTFDLSQPLVATLTFVQKNKKGDT